MPLRKVRAGLSVGSAGRLLFSATVLEETLDARLVLDAVFCADKRSGAANKIKARGIALPMITSYPTISGFRNRLFIERGAGHGAGKSDLLEPF